MNKLAIEVTANIPSAAQIEPMSSGMSMIFLDIKNKSPIGTYHMIKSTISIIASFKPEINDKTCRADLLPLNDNLPRKNPKVEQKTIKPKTF